MYKRSFDRHIWRANPWTDGTTNCMYSCASQLRNFDHLFSGRRDNQEMRNVFAHTDYSCAFDGVTEWRMERTELKVFVLLHSSETDVG